MSKPQEEKLSFQAEVKQLSLELSRWKIQREILAKLLQDNEQTQG